MPFEPGAYAAIDIGTNSTLLLVADVDAGGTVVPRIQRQATTRLGRGLTASGSIPDRARSENRRTVIDYTRIAREAGVRAIFAGATEAVRSAANGAELIKELEQETGIAVRCIDGDEEARLTFGAAVRSLEGRIGDGGCLLVDIGGGSTELVAGGPEGITRVRSFPVGAVRLTEAYGTAGLADEDHYRLMAEEIDSMLGPYLEVIPDMAGRTLVGVAGTVTTLAAMSLDMPVYDPDRIHGHRLAREEVWRLWRLLVDTPLELRKEITGLNPARADIIPAGALLLYQVMMLTGMDEITVSDRGLRYGLLLDGLNLL